MAEVPVEQTLNEAITANKLLTFDQFADEIPAFASENVLIPGGNSNLNRVYDDLTLKDKNLDGILTSQKAEIARSKGFLVHKAQEGLHISRTDVDKKVRDAANYLRFTKKISKPSAVGKEMYANSLVNDLLNEPNEVVGNFFLRKAVHKYKTYKTLTVNNRELKYKELGTSENPFRIAGDLEIALKQDIDDILKNMPIVAPTKVYSDDDEDHRKIKNEVLNALNTVKNITFDFAKVQKPQDAPENSSYTGYVTPLSAISMIYGLGKLKMSSPFITKTASSGKMKSKMQQPQHSIPSSEGRKVFKKMKAKKPDPRKTKVAKAKQYIEAYATIYALVIQKALQFKSIQQIVKKMDMFSNEELTKLIDLTKIQQHNILKKMLIDSSANDESKTLGAQNPNNTGLLLFDISKTKFNSLVDFITSGYGDIIAAYELGDRFKVIRDARKNKDIRDTYHDNVDTKALETNVQRIVHDVYKNKTSDQKEEKIRDIIQRVKNQMSMSVVQEKVKDSKGNYTSVFKFDPKATCGRNMKTMLQTKTGKKGLVPGNYRVYMKIEGKVFHAYNKCISKTGSVRNINAITKQFFNLEDGEMNTYFGDLEGLKADFNTQQTSKFLKFFASYPIYFKELEQYFDPTKNLDLKIRKFSRFALKHVILQPKDENEDREMVQRICELIVETPINLPKWASRLIPRELKFTEEQEAEKTAYNKVRLQVARKFKKNINFDKYAPTEGILLEDNEIEGTDKLSKEEQKKLQDEYGILYSVNEKLEEEISKTRGEPSYDDEEVDPYDDDEVEEEEVEEENPKLKEPQEKKRVQKDEVEEQEYSMKNLAEQSATDLRTRLEELYKKSKTDEINLNRDIYKAMLKEITENPNLKLESKEQKARFLSHLVEQLIEKKVITRKDQFTYQLATNMVKSYKANPKEKASKVKLHSNDLEAALRDAVTNTSKAMK